MIPAQRFYYLMFLGMAIALFLATFFDLKWGLIILVGYNLSLILIAVGDGNKVKQHQVTVTRHQLFKLSIARDNPVVLSVNSAAKPARVLIKDYYPLQFPVSIDQFRFTMAANTEQELIYTIKPDRRGEFEWGDIQVRQLSPLGLIWHDWKISATQQVAVYPDLMALKSLSLRLGQFVRYAV
jgi:uncharacterized protein (DUF58 family)